VGKRKGSHSQDYLLRRQWEEKFRPQNRKDERRREGEVIGDHGNRIIHRNYCTSRGK